jgi:hypothetical protein
MKKNLPFILFVLLFLFFAFFAKNVALISSTKSCAKFVKIWEVKGATLVKYAFKNKEGEIFSGNVDLKDLKIRSIDSLKKIECVKVRYSNFSAIFSEIDDPRVLDE